MLMRMDFENIVASLSQHYNIAFEGSVGGNCTYTIIGETKTQTIRIRFDPFETEVSIEIIDEGKYGYRSVQKVERIRDFDDKTIIKHITDNLSKCYKILM